MDSKIKLSIVTALFVSVSMFFGCKKETSLTPNASCPKANKELDVFVQNFFQNKHQLLVETRATQAEGSSNRVSAFFSTTAVAEKCLNDIKDQKTIRATGDLVYTGFEVKADIDYSTWKVEGDLVKFNVALFYSYTTNATDLFTGEAVTPTGYELYSFTVSEKEQGWLIVNEEQTIDPNYNPGIISSDEDMPASFNKDIAAYTYSGTAAAAFATAHWNMITNITNYYDFTNWGGDCTNFTSRCLREGGWKQTNNWFYKSSGASGNNMVTYKRSPSWAGANAFYQFINNSGQYGGVNGNNRVTPKFANILVPLATAPAAQWTTFYNTIKVLKKGDILELGNGGSPAIIGHNMIVTKVLPTAPFILLAYRNATGYLPAKDRPINEFFGRRLYGFFVKTSGN